MKYELAALARSPRFLAVVTLYIAISIISYAEILEGGFPPIYFPPQTSVPLFFVPLVISLAGIILGFDAVSGSVESRRAFLALSYPVERSTLFSGIILSRFLLTFLPALLSSALVFLTFWQPSLDFALRFVVAEGIFAIGALFWLVLASTISSVTKNSSKALLYSIVVVPFVSYGVNRAEVFVSAVLSLITGRIVVPGLDYFDPLYTTIEFYYRLVPGFSITQLAHQLFDCSPGCGGLAYSSLWDWLTGNGVTQIQYPPDIPSYIMLSVLIGVTFLVSNVLILSLRNMSI
jgi:ABC-type transport system involved in multi-copper enzyme maturation permease subunit